MGGDGTTGSDALRLSVDFQALRTLRAVHAEGSFSGAAARLGVTQSTVSYAVARLREVFGDPLFVRQGRGVRPTPRCEEVVRRAGRLLDEFKALTAPPSLDLAAAADRVTIACNHYERQIILPHAVRSLRRDAPGVRLVVGQSSFDGPARLRRGECDLLLGPFQIEDGDVYSRRLLDDGYVCAMSPDNPLTRVAWTLAAYEGAAHLQVTYGGGWQPLYRRALETAGVRPRAVLDVPSLGELASLVLGTDLIATVPRRIAARLGGGIALRPFPLAVSFGIDMFWTSRTHAAPLQRWLRSRIAEAAPRSKLGIEARDGTMADRSALDP